MARSEQRSPGRPSKDSLPIFSDKFQVKNFIKQKKIKPRKSKINPRTFFHTLVQLVGGTNKEGYHHAILKAFKDECSVENMPGKSAFCEARKKISYHFCEEIFDSMIKKFDSFRQTFRGLLIYAIDGQQLTMPRSKDIVDAGFTGRAVGHYRETYMPRGYFTHAYDVLSRVTKDLRFGPVLDEIHDAKKMIRGFEQNSLCLYDRLYFHPGLAAVHHQYQNFFLARCRSNACKEVASFFSEPWRKKQTLSIQGIEVHLIKFWNSKENAWDVFATNLPKNWIKPKLIKKLYQLRWPYIYSNTFWYWELN